MGWKGIQLGPLRSPLSRLSVCQAEEFRQQLVDELGEEWVRKYLTGIANPSPQA